MAKAQRGAAKEKPSSSVPFARAFSIHIFTALGAACALLALIAAGARDFVTMFWWLGAALFIDGIDGTLARRADVARAAPRWAGDILDFVVDFTTYVFVPAYALTIGGLLPEWTAVPLALAIVVSSALYFADRDMKTADNYFKGFPALWNAVAFHLFLLKLNSWFAAAIVALLVVLTFAPIRFVHPMRVARLQSLTILVLVIWAALSMYGLVDSLSPPSAVAWAATACALYLLTIGAMAPKR
jgi:phosphatidylcholine synthase